MPTIRPLGNRLLVKRKKAVSSKGGILLPESAQEKPKEGEVIAAGPGKKDEKGIIIPMNVKVSDHVLFGAYAGTQVETDNPDEEFLILSEDEVLGVLAVK